MSKFKSDSEERGSKGITVKKNENFSDWYSEVVQKAELADYAPIKGFMVIRPNAYAVWEKIQEYFNNALKDMKIRNAYFPLLIPNSFFKKEAEHAKGFSPELAYVKDTEEGEILALRPTSETIIYDSYSKWIRSHRDLPLKINQWCNIIRWEIKQTKPFIRTREFLWQEGHCAFERESEAEANINEIIHEYKKMVESLLAIPVLVGKKSKAETFAGAKTTMTIEALMPDGKALQCGTSHNLGQGFAKSFNISFKNKFEKEQYVWQTSWGFSTRLIGALVMVHGDDKGLVLPPRVAENKIAIVPIIFGEGRDSIIKKARELGKAMKRFNPVIDDRNEYTAGWKFNEWELKGIPLRVEIGPKDIAKHQAVFVRRDNGKREIVSEKKVDKRAEEILEEIQEELFVKAKTFLDKHIDSAKTLSELKAKLQQKKIVKVYLADEPSVEAELKEATGGATTRLIEKSSKEGTCIQSEKKTNNIAYIAKAY